MLGAQVGHQAVNLIVKLVLARLLSTADFGVVALAVSLVTLAEMFLDLGFIEALVQRPVLDDAARSTAFWLHLVIGGVMMAALLLTAPLIASLFEAPELAPILSVLSLTLGLLAPSPTFQVALTRDMRFRVLSVRLIGGTVLAGALAIAAAFANWGVWALVAYTLVRTLFSTGLLMAADPWKPSLVFDQRVASELWAYARYLLFTRIVAFVQRNADNFLVGKYLGVSALGVYSLAYQAVLLPLQYVTRPVLKVVFAALCTMDDRRHRHQAYLRTLEVLILLSWPMSLVGLLIAPPLIPVVLGEQWAEGTTVFAVLCAAPLFQTPLAAFNALAKANGAPQSVLLIQIAVAAVSLVAFVVGMRWGIEGVAVGYVTATVIILPLLLHQLARIGARPWSTASVLLRASLAGGLSLAAGFAVQSAASRLGLWARAMSVTAVVLATWGVMAMLLLPGARQALGWILRARARRGAPGSG